jgi:hypothetical protein
MLDVLGTIDLAFLRVFQELIEIVSDTGQLTDQLPSLNAGFSPLRLTQGKAADEC